MQKRPPPVPLAEPPAGAARLRAQTPFVEPPQPRLAGRLQRAGLFIPAGSATSLPVFRAAVAGRCTHLMIRPVLAHDVQIGIGRHVLGQLAEDGRGLC
jgi:hypothetical protein